MCSTVVVLLFPVWPARRKIAFGIVGSRVPLQTVTQGTTMSATNDENQSQPAVPTEEIFLELEELRELQELHGSVDRSEDEPAPATSEDDPSGIKARIARLRTMLSDRGAPLDE